MAKEPRSRLSAARELGRQRRDSTNERSAKRGSSLLDPVVTSSHAEGGGEYFQWLQEQVYGQDHRAAQRTFIWLPVSKKRVECSCAPLDPRRTQVSDLNPRNQELLSLEDPRVKELLASMAGSEEEGIITRQRDPVLVNRPNDEGLYDLVYGTRRRFVALHLCEQNLERRGFPLLAWVPTEDIPRVDQEALAISENEEREDLSIWEKAQLINRLDDGTRTAASIAQIVGLSERAVREYRKVTDIPIEVIKRLVSPGSLTLTVSSKISSLAKKEEGYKHILARLESAGGPFDDPKQLVEALTPSKPAQKSKLTTKKKISIKNAAGEEAFKVGWVRGKENQLKIDAYGIDESRLDALVSALEAIAKR